MRYGDLDPDPWDECRSAWESVGGETVEFVLTTPEPRRLGEAVRTAQKLVGSARSTTEFNSEYLDQPVEDVDESADRLATDAAFFINTSGAIEGTEVELSLGVENIVVKFAASAAFPEPTEEKRLSRAFRTLTEAALDLAESSGASAVLFGSEGLELAPEEGVSIWEREDEDVRHSSDVRSRFADYLVELDERLAHKRFEVMDELASRSGSARAYRRRMSPTKSGGAFIFVKLMAENVSNGTIERYARRATRTADRSCAKPPSIWRHLDVHVAVAMAHASEEVIDYARRDVDVSRGNFRQTILYVVDLSERRLHAKRWWISDRVRGSFILYGRRMLGFKKLGRWNAS